jgi:fumarylacetoacetate (FAA) hydrolase family protein
MSRIKRDQIRANPSDPFHPCPSLIAQRSVLLIDTIPESYNSEDYVIPSKYMTTDALLPADADSATLIGRIQMSGVGPCVVTVRSGDVFDITDEYESISGLCEESDSLAAARQASGTKIASLQDILNNTPVNVRDESKPYLLTPIDAQPIMAAGVTFVESLMGRLIEERARGQASKEEEVRAWMMKVVSNIQTITGGIPLEKTVPGTETAIKVLDYLINEEGLSHHYLNVGYGELAEIFTKAHSFNSIGTHEPAGYHWLDPWTNPEPEGAVVINSRGCEVGAVLSEDMNGRKIEGSSALLVSYMKNTNRSCVIGPFIRLYDEHFTPETFRKMDIHLEISEPDGAKVLADTSYSISQYSRNVSDVVQQLVENFPIPSGAVLSLGTGLSLKNFTFQKAQVVHFSSRELGAITHPVGPSNELPRNTYGINEFVADATRRALTKAQR